MDTRRGGHETPVPGDDYIFVYQGASVSIDHRRAVVQRQRPAKPSDDRCRSVRTRPTKACSPATSPPGFAYTPSNDPALIDSDHTLNYLVTDTDGHVAQVRHHDPHPRRRRPQPTTRGPRRRRPHRREHRRRLCFTTGNDFDPDGDGFGVVSVATPAHGVVVNSDTGFDYTPNAGFSGIENITYTIRDTHGLTSNGTRHGVGRHRCTVGPRPRSPTAGLHVRLPRRVGVDHHSPTARQRQRPASQTLTVVAVSEPSTDGVLTGDLATGFTYTPSTDPALIDTDHSAPLPRHRHRRPRHPRPPHRPHPRHRRPQPTTRRPRRCGPHRHRQRR